MSCLPGICTISLGRAAAGHSLTTKLDMASKFGFKGIELFYEDLISIVHKNRLISNHQPSSSSPSSAVTPAEELAAAHEIRMLCHSRGLSIICLQPFWQYEGLLDREEHKRQLTEKLPLWFQLCEALDTDLIQVPSNFLSADQLSTDPKVTIQDLQEMADAGLAFGHHDGNATTDISTPTDPAIANTNKTPSKSAIRFAYEALAWGTHISTWESAYSIVLAVDRPNFGLLLDTFNITGCSTFADPSSPFGKVENAHEKLTASLEKLVEEVDLSKVFYVQIAGAERLAKPLVEGHELWNEHQDARMSWSRGCRLFYGEEGVYGDVEMKEGEEGVSHGDDLHTESAGGCDHVPASDGKAAHGSETHGIGGGGGGGNIHVEEEKGGINPEQRGGEYLPISQICAAIFNALGFRGWVSMEVFHRETWNAENPNVPREFAQRGMLGWEKLKNEFGLEQGSGVGLSDGGCDVVEEDLGFTAVAATGDESGTESGSEVRSASNYVALDGKSIVGCCESAEDADDEDEDEDEEDGDGVMVFL